MYTFSETLWSISNVQRYFQNVWLKVVPIGFKTFARSMPIEHRLDKWRDVLMINEYCKLLMYSGNNKIAIIALCPYALLQNCRLYKNLNWTCCCCSRSPLYLDHAIQDSIVIALFNVHAIFKWFTVYQNNSLRNYCELSCRSNMRTGIL